ncbi:hypothetical protein OIU78_024221 [Salix suchowensis]|nr:hypothetical protein OIU78_024221 [Salix suchowensis]
MAVLLSSISALNLLSSGSNLIPTRNLVSKTSAGSSLVPIHTPSQPFLALLLFLSTPPPARLLLPPLRITVSLRLLLSVKVLAESENDVVVKEFKIPTDYSDLLRLEKDVAPSGGSLWFLDLKYKTVLFSAALPRGCGKFLDVLPDPNNELLYCAHLDGKLSIWRRKEGEQVHVMCAMEELMPSIGTSVPFSFAEVDFDNPFDFCDDSVHSTTHMISISDDGKVWNWLLTAEGTGDNLKDTVADSHEIPLIGDNANAVAVTDGLSKESRKQQEFGSGNKNRLPSTLTQDLSFRISLVGQLQLLSSTVTMLAVPSPSLIATLARGGSYPAVAVPLVALGTQCGTIDVVDVSANAVAASFSVHNSTVRGLRWLGNSRLVSFSYNQVSEKNGGYNNRLVVTCLRSGLNRPFRVLQKPERAPIRALRTSSSGRYLLILFRDAPVEVWAMTKTPIMLRSLALPFTVLEWTLPTVPRPVQNGPSKQVLWSSKDQTPVAQDGASTAKEPASESKAGISDASQDDTAESFAFALVNGALGVFEVHGRRIRDFRPKWPSSSFVSSDGLITAMAYRLPHVVMGDRSGNIRWWDVTTGHSSSFNTHREGIRRIKFSPVVPGDRSRGLIAVLFYDNTFSIFDLDLPDPLANSLLQPLFPGTLVLELDWLPLRTNKNDPLVLCIAGADSSFRLVEVNIIDKKLGHVLQPRAIKEKFRPMPICSPILLPTPHALALRMILQLGVQPSWFNTCSTTIDKRPHLIPGTASFKGDLRNYIIDLPPVGDSVVPRNAPQSVRSLQKRRLYSHIPNVSFAQGCILDDETARLYAVVVKKGCAARFAFAAAIFGETSEALFWLQLPRALKHLMDKLVTKSTQKVPVSASTPELDDVAMLNRISSKGKSVIGTDKKDPLSEGQLRSMAFQKEELWESACERIPWHEKLEGEEAIQNRVHELVSIGNLEAAVSLLLSTSPESSYFYVNALRAVALSSAVSRSLHELAVKVVAANMVQTDRSLSGTHLLCAVGRYQEACSQLQDAGCWTDAATLAATHLSGSDYARVLLRWANHVLHTEHNIWRALILYVAAGALQDALEALREAQQPDTASMFILACHEGHAQFISNLGNSDDESGSSIKDALAGLPGLNPENEDVIAVGEYYGQYQRKLVHLCMDSQPFSD